MRPIKMAAAGALVLGATLAMTACTAATDVTSGEATERTLSAQAEECVGRADDRLAGAMRDVDFVVPTAPLDLAALQGRTIWFITVTMNQFSVDMSDGVEEAVAAAGMELVRYDGQGMTNRFNEGIEQAIAQNAAGIILVGIDPAVVSAALSRAAAAGIPVQNMLNSDATAPVPSGMYGNLTSDYTGDGEAAADWILSDSGCAADVAILSSSSVAVWENTAAGAKARIEQECQDCTVTILDIDVANVATAVGSQLQATLQRNSAIDYIFPAWDSAVTYVDPVLAAANSDAKVLGRDGLRANLEAIQAGGNQDMTVAMPPTGWIGWLAVDDLGRAILDAPAPGYVIPTRVVDTTNVGDASAAQIFPNFDGYQAAFQAAWTRTQ